MRNYGLVVAILVVLLVGGYFLFAGNRKQVSAPAPEPNENTLVEEEPVLEEEQGELREVSVEGDEYSFSPSSLTVKKGEKIRLTFTNVGSSPHNFVIDKLNISTETVPGGSSDTVEFTADTSGTFDFYCGIGNHRSLGMEGSLDVE